MMADDEIAKIAVVHKTDLGEGVVRGGEGWGSLEESRRARASGSSFFRTIRALGLALAAMMFEGGSEAARLMIASRRGTAAFVSGYWTQSCRRYAAALCTR